ncbi:MAG: phage terminase large subunit [Rhodospirillales bacterium]|nr:phage terminase large subunit [Alphaproteobacteria bacterium]MCB9981570.1 phage terminase large subunit [Rhodospirillales bacterium]
MNEIAKPPSLQSTKFDISTADFPLFVVLWNQRMGLRTPQIHLKIARWLEWNWSRKNTRLLLMAFRSAGKSTIAGLFSAWLLYRKADLRILVLAADFTLAKKMVRNVKRIIERHPLTANMKPENADQWASDRFTIKRTFESRDPSMMAKGITANITGSRADIVICDDVEVPNTCDTAEKRRELRERLGEMEYVLVPGGTQIYVGTPHNYHTIYADKPRSELGEEREFLNGFERLKIPVLDEKGQSAWIERYSEADIARMKRAAGPNKFASQMMLQPVNIAEGRLNPDLLRHYDDDLEYCKELQTLFLGQIKLVSASAFWDPSFGSATGDHSVVAILFSDAEGNFYLHHIEYIRTDAGNEQDEATQQCRIVSQIAKNHYLPAMTVEINGIGRFLPNILRNELSRAKSPCALKEISQSRAKDLRILEAFDAVLAARRLYVHISVLKTLFMTEMREWRPGSNKGYDDGLDAVAGALAQAPDRLPRLYGRGAHNWMKSARLHKADTDFKI